MAFGQPSGPPASAKQVRDLLALLVDAGHSDFRDARGPMGFTQRQAGGKFSRDEAQAFIEQLEEAAHAGSSLATAPPPRPSPAQRALPPERPAPVVRLSAVEQAVRGASDEVLAAEVRRRGWTIVER